MFILGTVAITNIKEFSGLTQVSWLTRKFEGMLAKNKCDSLNLWSAKSMSNVPDNVNRPIAFWVRVNRQASLISTIYIYSHYGCIKRQMNQVTITVKWRIKHMIPHVEPAGRQARTAWENFAGPLVYESTHKGPRSVVHPAAAEAYLIIHCTSFCICLVI